MKLLLSCLVVCMLALDVPAQAYDDGNAWIKKTLKQQWRADRAWRKRHWRAPVKVKHQPKHRSKRWRDDDDDGDRDRCKRLMSGIGAESYDPEAAKAAAQKSWMENVKWKWGIRFMDPGNAKDRPEFVCARSGAGSRASEKGMKLIPRAWKGGDFLQQCEMIARPCPAPSVRDKDD